MIDIEKLRYFFRDQSGTAMTEFIITVPIFLFLFSGLLALGNISQGAVAAHTEAAAPFWREAYAAERQSSRMSPRGQSWTSLPIGGAASMLSNYNNRMNGHWGESASAVRLMPLVTGRSLPNDAAGQQVRSNLTTDPRRLIGDSRAASGVADDSFRLSLGNLSQIGAGRDALLTILVDNITRAFGVNLGYGAGARYGTVTSTTSSVVKRPLGLPDATYRVSYSSLVSPSPTRDTSLDGLLPGAWRNSPESRAYTASRMWVETEQPYRNLFSIFNRSNSINSAASNAVPVVYQNYGTNPDNPWWCIWCD